MTRFQMRLVALYTFLVTTSILFSTLAQAGLKDP